MKCLLAIAQGDFVPVQHLMISKKSWSYFFEGSPNPYVIFGVHELLPPKSPLSPCIYEISYMVRIDSSLLFWSCIPKSNKMKITNKHKPGWILHAFCMSKIHELYDGIQFSKADTFQVNKWVL